MPRAGYDLSPLHRLLVDDDEVARSRQAVADQLNRLWDRQPDDHGAPDSSWDLVRELGLGADAQGPLGIPLILRWQREALNALVQLQLAFAIYYGATRKAAITALGYSSSGSFQSQFPDVDRLVGEIEAAFDPANAGSSLVTFHIDGLRFQRLLANAPLD